MKDNVVAITGASKGIGAELARQLASKGARLVLAARNEKELEAVAEQCRERGASVVCVKADVAVDRDCQAIIAAAVLAFGRLDTLVNNAGASMWAKFEDIQDMSILERLMQVNYMGAVYCTHHALPHLRETGGRIVGISSLAGRTGVPTRTGYSASKHAMTGFFDSLRIELAGTGVTVTLVAPDFVLSEIHRRAAGPDGRPLGHSPMQESSIMTAEQCARHIVNAMQKRQRLRILSLRGRLGRYVRLVAPGLIDAIAARAVRLGR
jgi:short-subunit dehydrogenase